MGNGRKNIACKKTKSIFFCFFKFSEYLTNNQCDCKLFSFVQYFKQMKNTFCFKHVESFMFFTNTVFASSAIAESTHALPVGETLNQALETTNG